MFRVEALNWPPHGEDKYCRKYKLDTLDLADALADRTVRRAGDLRLRTDFGLVNRAPFHQAPTASRNDAGDRGSPAAFLLHVRNL